MRRRLGDKVSLEYVQGVVKESRTNGFYCYLAQFDYGLALLMRNLAKSVMIMIGSCPVQLNCNFWKVILVCETFNERWATSGSVSRITAKDFLEYYAVKYVTTTDGAYLSYSSSRPCFFDLSSAGRVRNDNLLWVSGECLQRSDAEPLELNNGTITKGKYIIENRTIICMLNYIFIVNVYLTWSIFYYGISCKVLRKESFIDFVATEGTELEAILKNLGINRFKRVASKDDKVMRSQAKRRMARKTQGSMEENMLTPELNISLKLARLNKMPDGLVDMATVSSTVVRNLAKRKAVKRGAASRSATSDSVDDSSKRRKVTPPAKSQVVLGESVTIAEGADLRARFEVETGLMEEQCCAKAREKGVTIVEDDFKKFARALSGVQHGLRDSFSVGAGEGREAAALKLNKVRAESVAEAERLVSASATSQNNLAGKLYQLRYTKADILAFSEGSYEEKEIVDKRRMRKWRMEIKSLCLRVVDLEGLLAVEKNSSADLQLTVMQKELDVAREREEQTLLYNTVYEEEYEALISSYEDRLDDNVKHSLNLEEVKSQVEDKTAILLSKDLALNQLISELAELKERAVSGSQHDAELAEYRISALNDKISDMKCNILALNEQLLKREIDLDTARTNLALSEADFEKLSCSIGGKDFEFRNSTQICDSLIARLDRLKADLRRFKEK
ncbi:hypothetical protein GIB67_037613 [Kingdonia uniflora]|uniref:Uncharacterized protein n=1 Tax=Kingdonia uniflora TaxID=39325 RepID=A0A7J7LST4_9MAGN|nr:hypothetical protein GIB67_037613 [Kingdonia uniflora]